MLERIAIPSAPPHIEGAVDEARGEPRFLLLNAGERCDLGCDENGAEARPEDQQPPRGRALTASPIHSRRAARRDSSGVTMIPLGSGPRMQFARRSVTDRARA
jgi:hypothetical protein